MKKKFIALFCALVLVLGAVPAASALEGEAARAADSLATLGLIDSSGSLERPATRAQGASLLVSLAGAGEAARLDDWNFGFSDVPARIARDVNYAARQGWITGVSLTRFQPDEPLTANAWSAFLLRMLGYSDKNGDFAVSDAAVFAQRIGVISQPYSGTLDRGQMYRMAWDALFATPKDGVEPLLSRLLEEGEASRSAANAMGLLNPALTARQIADRHTAAVFGIETYETQKQIRDESPVSDASGFFISADGLAVTNYHSIEDAIHGTATLSTGETYPIESVLYYDPAIDIAVIRVSPTSTEGETTSAFAFLEMVPTGDLRPGDTVYTLGNPLGLGLAVSSGVISATNREVESYALPCIMNTADISRGSSGGALMNIYGQVVGVTSGAYSYGNNMYLAVPIDPVLAQDLTGQGLTLTEVRDIERTRAQNSPG